MGLITTERDNWNERKNGIVVGAVSIVLITTERDNWNVKKNGIVGAVSIVLITTERDNWNVKSEWDCCWCCVHSINYNRERQLECEERMVLLVLCP